MSQILRIIDGEPAWVDKKPSVEQLTPRPIVSDKLGCIVDQVDELRADAAANGFTAIEWKPDPKLTMNGEPFTGWYDYHCSCPEQHRRYLEHRQWADHTSGNGSGGVISQEHLEEMGRRMRTRYPRRERA